MKDPNYNTLYILFLYFVPNRSPTILQPAVLWSGHHWPGRGVAHLYRQHQHVSYIPSLLPSVYGSVITCTGETPLYVKAGQTAFPVCLEIATRCYHMESRRERLFPSTRSKIRHNRLWGRLYKVLGLSSWGCVYRQTAGCATVSYCICQAASPPHASRVG